ncbi:MAG: type I-U CRISPR-associated helicase/endonuclease Cas3 [Planctomycetota bacterium]|nr:MAG: type I-U CRISPR-associated helicase/endonuclease Cas3 [Planctomycetota bacterium]REK40307.1 MAG: type I-U CRISPR-associated helicase/endonuclease Cas3 [Planctomycetota bacterium]
MSQIDSNQFSEFFEAVNGFRPYDWQQRLVDRVLESRWPEVIDLPTGAGKTACLEATLFALACQAQLTPEERSVPVRIFFCVNRRIIVDEAYDRAVRLARKLLSAAQRQEPGAGILGRVAKALRKVAGNSASNKTPPLDVLPLRGGAFRDNRWARSATQPTIVTTTVDQLGSRLLFRGYGVTRSAAPIQASLIAYDSLILLDEAHISRPFLDTLDAVRRYLDPRRWAEESIGVAPMRVIPMTATPPTETNEVLRLSDADREAMQDRLQASKRATLISVNDVAKKAAELSLSVNDVAKKAAELSRDAIQDQERPLAIGIIVNRVAIAKQIHQLLVEEKEKAKKSAIPPETPLELVIGSMRPVDRDEQTERLRALVGPDRPKETEQPSIVVSTQCLEVGADYDFDVLITECASLDALRQRFGRLNRGGRPIETEAWILIDKKQVKSNDKLKDDKPDDPIYGNALARTWNWLFEHKDHEADTIDFGISAFDTLLAENDEKPVIPPELRSPSSTKHAPVMLPAYVDFWRQTAPVPSPDPDVSLFLHGEAEGASDLRVCWRIELDVLEEEHWADAVALLPPTSPECMSVPIGRFKRWFIAGTGDKKLEDSDSDLLEVAEDVFADREQQPSAKSALLWRGSRSESTGPLKRPSDLRPGDTVVLSVRAMGWGELGHIPSANEEGRSIDCAEHAYAEANDKPIIRLFTDDAECESFKSSLTPPSMLEAAIRHASEPLSNPEWRELMTEVAQGVNSDSLRHELATLSRVFRVEPYPNEMGVVLIGYERLGHQNFMLPALDEELSSFADQNIEVYLKDHTQHVVDTIARVLQHLPMAEFADIYRVVAELHDLGKADERFQAMLRQEDRTDAWLWAASTYTNALLAKSGGTPLSHTQYRSACERAELPRGFRHELLSLQIAERHPSLPDETSDHDLVLHLIAAHHGKVGPFAPVAVDDDPPPVEVDGVELTAADRKATPPHRLDSGVADRFWRLVRRYGWWGLAYLETVFRLADWQASAAEQAGVYADAEQSQEEVTA